jgi:outer membrane biosynthesis protein TonB
MEVPMNETTTVETTTEPMEEPVSKKKTTKPKTAKTAKPKAKPPKAAKPKKEKTPKEPVPGRVFAIRVTDAELEAIHKASGPRNATRFIRLVAAAFAAEDHAAFKAVLEEARKLRA